MSRVGGEGVEEQPDPAPARKRSRSRRRRLAGAILSLLLGLALLVAALPRFADFAEVGDIVADLGGVEIAALLILAAWNILTYQFVLVAVLPLLTVGQAFVVSQMSTAVSNTLPAGSAVGVGVTYAILSSFGHGASSIALAAVVTGIWNGFAKLGLPLIALALLAVQGNAGPALLSAALTGVAALAAGVGIMALVLSSDRLALRIGKWLGDAASAILRLFGREPVTTWGDGLRRFRHRSVGLLRDRWHWLTGATLVSHLSLFALLLVCLRTLGVPASDVTWTEAFGAFALVRLVTAFPITPGGLGIVELGLTAALIVAGGPDAEVVAAVLVYRVLTYLLQIPLGVISYVIWQRKRGWRGSAEETTVPRKA